MSEEAAKLRVLIEFDRPVPEGPADEFVEILAAELEYRDPVDRHYRDPGWGMGQARVMKVTREKETE